MSDAVDSLLEARNDKEQFNKELVKTDSQIGPRKNRMAASNFTKGKTLVDTVDASTRRNITQQQRTMTLTDNEQNTAIREAFREELEDTIYVESDEELEDSLLLSISVCSDDEEEIERPDFVITGDFPIVRNSRHITVSQFSSINPGDDLVQVQQPNTPMPTRRQQQLKKNEDKPILGTIYYLVYVALYSVNFLVVALLYARVGESLHAFQLLLGRSVWVILLTVVFYNWNIKKYTYDSVKGKSKTALTFRTLQSSISNIIKNWAPKYIPLTIISIIGNLGPMVTVVLAFFLLKEKLKRIELCVMVATLLCIVVVIVAGTDQTAESQDVSPTVIHLVYLALILNAFLSAGGTIAMRKMKKFHESVVSWYSNWAVLVVSVLVMLVTGDSFTIFMNFTWDEHLLLFSTGLCTLASQTFRFKALKLQSAAKLQKLQPLTTMMSFAFDKWIFHYEYQLAANLALYFIFLLYAAQGLHFVLASKAKKNKKIEERKNKRISDQTASEQKNQSIIVSSGKLASSKTSENERILTIIGEEEVSLTESDDRMPFVDPKDFASQIVEAEADSALVQPVEFGKTSPK